MGNVCCEQQAVEGDMLPSLPASGVPDETKMTPKADELPMPPRATVTSTPGKRWKVLLQRSQPQEMFGIVWITNLQAAPDELGFPVRTIREGRVVDKFNQANPENAVKPGDIIMSANGKSAPEPMKQELVTQMEVELEILRPT
mmetsp:Transcript_136255/g.308035  ORF Transcript_136255/g.308035 Transcript_136255/m.308035 type:complete len:143 (-) Transcript_136255:173-601(-)